MWYNRATWRPSRSFPTFLAALVLAAPVCAAAATPAAGDRFPDLAGFGLEGEVPDLTQARVLIVDFWASWCAPCRQSFPVFDELHASYAARGLTIVAVSVDRDAKAMETFIKRMKPRFSVARDPGQKLVAAVAVPTMPTSFVIDRKGIVRFVHRGFHGQKSRDEYVEQIEELLSEGSEP